MRLPKELLKAGIIALGCLALISLTSCATSKKKCIEKYCTQDTVRTQIIVHDTIVTESVTKDTVFSTSVDTVIVTKDKLTIKYIKYRDSVYLSGKYDADTIFRTDTVQVSMPVNCPKYSDWDHARAIPWWILLAAGIGFALCLYVKRS